MTDHLKETPETSTTFAILATPGDSQGFEILKALVAQAVPPVSSTRCDSIEAAIRGGTRILVPVRMPFAYMQRALQAGTAPGAALDSWRTDCENLLEDCRKARRQVVIVDAEMLATRPAAVAEALAQRLGLRFGTVPAAGPAARSDLSPVHAVIAAAQLAGDSRALDLAAELEAMCTGPVSDQTPSDQDIAGAVSITAQLAEERDLLRESLRQMATDMERLVEEKPDTAEEPILKSQLEAADRLHEETQVRRALRESVLGNLILKLTQHGLAERERLQAEAQAGREGLETAFAQERERLEGEFRHERERLEGELRAARDKIAELFESSSWKITGPMRAARRALSRR